MSLTRTQISLSDADRALLVAAGRRSGRSMSALIREAIRATYGPSSSTDQVRAALEATFGVIDTEESGETLTESIRTGHRLAELR